MVRRVTGVIGFTGLVAVISLVTFYNLPATPSNITSRDQALMQLDVIITFPALFDNEAEFKLSGTITEEGKTQRMKEYIVCLKRTLSHRYVSKVHVLYDQDVLPSFIHSQINSEFKSKLIFQKVKDSVMALTAYNYVYSNLQGRLVMIKHADTYPGDGLDLLNKDMIREKRLMYALTRRGQLEDNCNMGNIRKFGSSNTCHDKRYQGSHDAYIFVPNGELPTNVTTVLKDKHAYQYGIDNLTIWIFQHIFNYVVLNPCKVVHIFHFHCSMVRNLHYLDRVKHEGSLARPTDKLY